MDRHVGSGRGPGIGRLAEAVRSALGTIEPLVFVAVSWWLAVVAIGVLQGAHDGLHEHLELPPILHLVRDAALAVPAAASAVLIGVLATGATFGATRARRSAARVVWVVATAAAFAVLSIPGNALHGVLFGAEAEEELSPLADALLDGAIALIGALLALVPVALVIGPPMAAIDRSDPSPDPARGLRPGPGDLVARSSK